MDYSPRGRPPFANSFATHSGVIPSPFKVASSTELNLKMRRPGNRSWSGCGWQKILTVGSGQSAGHGNLSSLV